VEKSIVAALTTSSLSFLSEVAEHGERVKVCESIPLPGNVMFMERVLVVSEW